MAYSSNDKKFLKETLYIFDIDGVLQPLPQYPEWSADHFDKVKAKYAFDSSSDSMGVFFPKKYKDLTLVDGADTKHGRCTCLECCNHAFEIDAYRPFRSADRRIELSTRNKTQFNNFAKLLHDTFGYQTAMAHFNMMICTHASNEWIRLVRERLENLFQLGESDPVLTLTNENLPTMDKGSAEWWATQFHQQLFKWDASTKLWTRIFVEGSIKRIILVEDSKSNINAFVAGARQWPTTITSSSAALHIPAISYIHVVNDSLVSLMPGPSDIIPASVFRQRPFEVIADYGVLPTRETSGSAGYDLFMTSNSKVRVIQASTDDDRWRYAISLGVKLRNKYVPEGTYGQVKDCSGTFFKCKGFEIFDGVIDRDYEGEIIIGLKGKLPEVNEGEQYKIGQIVFVKYETAGDEPRSNEARGAQGCGESINKYIDE